MPESSLRDRLAEALRTAAFLCDDCCTLEDEAACDAAHPIQATCLHFDQVADITGPVDDIADAMAAVVQAELDAGEIAFEKRGQIITRLEARAQKAEAERNQYYTALQGSARREAGNSSPQQVARIRALHQQYRDVFAVGDHDSCAHCNQISGAVVPWPCPTITALATPKET